MSLWIREKLEGKKEEKLLMRGRLVGVGKEMAVAGEENLRSPELLAPYGFFCALPSGCTVLTAEGVILGLPMEAPEELSEGEVMLRNGFGAEILLRNDGSVVINGQVFERNEA